MRVRGWACGVALAMAAIGGAKAQQAIAPPATSVTGVLRSMASRAGVVFVGSVQRIVPEGGVVEVDFKVQQPIIGVSGASYVLREWAGRWTGTQQRYRVGQTAMFFLHAPGASGLSSPVDGMVGVVPVLATGNAGAMVDLRWVATHVMRPVGTPLASVDKGAMKLSDATSLVAQWKLTTMPEPVMYPMPGGVKPRPVAVMNDGQAQGERSGVPTLLQPQELTDAQP